VGDLSLLNRPTRRLALLAGFAVVYLVWGSTYLAITFAVETFPPLLMAGSRFLFASLPLLGWFYWRGARPTARQWSRATLTGALLFLGSNGLLSWGQKQLVPSGRAALLISTTPLWMGLLGWLFYRMPRPGVRTIVGMLAGFLGAALLIKAPRSDTSDGSLLGYLAVFAVPICWAIGTYQTRRFRISEDILLASALQMFSGSVLLILAGTVLNEWPQLAERSVSFRSMLALAYLVVFGSLAFSVYTWLIRVASPTAVSTYAYVNPLVAVALGWLFNGEALNWTVLLASILILGAVVLITLPVSARPPGPAVSRQQPVRDLEGE
jgi:drug/metabolite transporter (DMT)-like permease